MNEGISLDETCANNVVGTKEDFERVCNNDGTVKSQPKTTTFTLKNDITQSVTINTTHLQIGLSVILLLAIAIIGLIIWKIKRKKSVK
jgi:hypothetical protein